MSARPLPVLVVDDSPLSVDVLASRIARDPRLEVVGVAYDGLRAVELARSLRPAVITMDLRMPKLDGLGAIERIMRERPTRILVVTAQDDRGTLAFEALRRGASDLLEKPGPHDGSDVLCERIWALARAPIRAPRGEGVPTPTGGRAERARAATPSRSGAAPGIGASSPRASRVRPVPTDTHVSVIGVVASTGGPAALATVLGALPTDLAAGILIVQHLPAGFVERLARWLDGVSPLSVSIATEGELVTPGRALIAGDGRHLTIDGRRRVRLLDGPPIGGHRPSGTRLLTSLADELGARAAGVVLTGMGKDGADGLLAIRRAGGRTLAQDEASSAVFGMPRAALEAQAAEASVPLDGLAGSLIALSGRARR